jgi:hypothetical protein
VSQRAPIRIDDLAAPRLRLAQLLREHPEIREERIEAPIVILGLPRTGTTHLHNLLGEVPSLRTRLRFYSDRFGVREE